MDAETDFTDKNGKRICIGDTVQLRTSGSNSKRGGPVLKRVIRHGHRVHLVDVNEADTSYGGYELTEQQAQIAVIIERAG